MNVLHNGPPLVPHIGPPLGPHIDPHLGGSDAVNDASLAAGVEAKLS